MTLDKTCFLAHCDWIYQNRYKLENRLCADFVVSGFVINAFASPYYSYCIDKITVRNLIKLWNNGFVYNNLPLIQYSQSYGDNSTHIAYIDNGNLINQTFAYHDEQKYIPTNEVKQILKDLREIDDELKIEYYVNY